MSDETEVNATEIVERLMAVSQKAEPSALLVGDIRAGDIVAALGALAWHITMDETHKVRLRNRAEAAEKELADLREKYDEAQRWIKAHINVVATVEKDLRGRLDLAIQQRDAARMELERVKGMHL